MEYQFQIIKTTVEIDKKTSEKLNVLSVYKNTPIEQLLEKAVQMYADEKYTTLMAKLNDTDKEDLGLMLLMRDPDRSDTISRS